MYGYPGHPDNRHVPKKKYPNLPIHIAFSRMICPVCSTVGQVEHCPVRVEKTHWCKACSFGGHPQDFIVTLAAKRLADLMERAPA